jgi:hypothetical protein
LKRCLISGHCLTTLCRGTYRVTANNFPQDAEIVGASFDVLLGHLILVVRSDTFEPVLEGQIPPLMEGPVVEVMP